MSDSEQNNDLGRRSFFQLMAAGAAGGLFACASGPRARGEESGESAEWPEPQEGQLEVIPFATSHLAYGGPEDDEGGHLFYLDAGDVLGDKRQRELEELAELIVARQPDRVAVEFPATQQEQLDQLYRAYCDGKDLPPMELPFDFERSEIVQVAFRVADRLGHERVLGVDHPQGMNALIGEDESAQLVPFEEAVEELAGADFPMAHPATNIERAQQILDEGSLVEHFHDLNRPDGFAAGNDRMFYAYGFEYSDVDAHLPIDLMVAWYQRNLRVLANLWNMVEEDDKRVFLLFGASHIPQFRHVLDLAPMYAPADPMTVFNET